MDLPSLSRGIATVDGWACVACVRVDSQAPPWVHGTVIRTGATAFAASAGFAACVVV